MGSHLLLDMSNIPTNTLVDNGRKKILVIGKTGTGKSSLCNVLVGADHDADLFPVSAEAMSCTQRTVFCDAFFNKDKEWPFSLIDTIGFDDPDKDDDAGIIAELVLRLKHGCDFVNLFIIAVNGQNPRLDGSLLGMIKIFEGMFGQDFWKQVVVLFTRMPMDEKAKKKREKNSKQSDDELAQKYMAEVAKRFKHGKQIDFQGSRGGNRKGRFEEGDCREGECCKSYQRASDPVGERARGRCKEACGPREATSSGKPQCRKRKSKDS